MGNERINGNNGNKPLKDNNDSKKILTMVVLILTLMVCTTSATYAYFALTVTNSATVKGEAATVGLTLSVTEAPLKAGNTGAMVPQLVGALGTAMNTTNQCVDGNGNIICKVYTIKITNNSSAAVDVYGTIKFTNPTTNLKWRRVGSATTIGSGVGVAWSPVSASTTEVDLTTAGTCASPYNEFANCTNIDLAKSGGSTTYYIIVWINETGSSQNDSGTWSATINFNGAKGTGVTSTITA